MAYNGNGSLYLRVNLVEKKMMQNKKQAFLLIRDARIDVSLPVYRQTESNWPEFIRAHFTRENYTDLIHNILTLYQRI